MSNRLLRSLVDLVSPPTSLALHAPEFFPLCPGAWQQSDAQGVPWGFLGLRLEMHDDPESIQDFLSTLVALPVTAIKIGVYSRPQRGVLTRAWAAANNTEDEVTKELVQSRKNFLRQDAGLRERHGFLVLQRPLSTDAETPWAPLEELLSYVEGFARSKGTRISLMRPEDLSYFTLGAVAPEYQPHVSDMAVDLGADDPSLALQMALKELDAAQYKGSYRAVLTLATSDQNHTDWANPSVRAHCVVRLRAEPDDLRRANQLLMTGLRKHGVLARPQAPAAQPMWPSVRMQSRWPLVKHQALISYLGWATRLPGQSASKGGVPVFTEAGELRAFDPFMGYSGNNTFIAGSAGAGRHFLAKEMVTQCLQHPSGGAAWVVDDSSHYNRMADALGGTVVTPVWDQGGMDVLAACESTDTLWDHMSLIRNWLAMLTDRDEEDIDAAAWALWELALMNTMEALGRLSLPDFVESLRRVDHPRALEAAAEFDPYLPTGEYGAIFTGATAMPDNNFVVFDLPDYRHLPQSIIGKVAQSIQVQVLMHWQRIRYTDRQRKLLVIDDQCLVANQKLLCVLMRHTRMLCGSIVLLGRLADVLPDGPLGGRHGSRGSEVLGHFNHLLLQRATAEQAHRFCEEYGYAASVREELFRLRTIADRLADVLLISHEYGESARFVFRVDALSQALYSARPQIASRYRELRRQGLTPLAALTLCAENGPSIIR